MTDRAEIERLLNQTGRTLEGLPEEHSREDRNRELSTWMPWGEKMCHQSDVIELLVGALRNALDKPMQRPLTYTELRLAQVVWLEDVDKPFCIPALVCCSIGHELAFRGKHSIVQPSKDDYSIRWRAWASRPTDEEREAAAWEN